MKSISLFQSKSALVVNTLGQLVKSTSLKAIFNDEDEEEDEEFDFDADDDDDDVQDDEYEKMLQEIEDLEGDDDDEEDFLTSDMEEDDDDEEDEDDDF